MDKKINLIPSELTVSSKTVKLVQSLNRLSIIGFAVLIFLTVGLIAVSVYFSIEIGKITSQIDSLKTKIVSMQKTEQQLVLIKDKISKIEFVLSSPNIDKNIENFKALNDVIALTPESTITEVEIKPDLLDLSFSTKTSDSFSQVFEKLDTFKYKNILLSALNYTSTGGFLANILFK